MKAIQELSKKCDERERSLLSRMINQAAEYVKSVVVMETAAINIKGLDSEDWRDARESTDRSRTSAHDAFISLVNIANRICDKYGVTHIYTGSEDRSCYGDFAIKIVAEIFANRR